MNLFSLNGKNALVIGGSKGLGKGIALGLAKSGASVVLCARNQSDLNSAVNDIKQYSDGKVSAYSQDITSVQALQSLVDRIFQDHGQIDILVNSAGSTIRKPALAFSEDDWDRVQDVQIKYVFFMCQAVAKQMIQNGIGGKIINIASLTSKIGMKDVVSYACAKGAIVQLTKTLAIEFAPHNINVNAIGPGYYETDMTRVLFEDKEKVASLLSRIPMNRFGFPQDLEGAAVYLASSASDYVTGQVIYVDGGWLAH